MAERTPKQEALYLIHRIDPTRLDTLQMALRQIVELIEPDEQTGDDSPGDDQNG